MIAQFLVSIQAKDQEDADNFRKHLSDMVGPDGSVEAHQGPTQAVGKTHDAYGNPYDASGKGSNTHDAYGNPYNKGTTK